MILAFAFHIALSTRLYDLHAFAQYDVLFNADPNEGLVNLGQGWGKSEFKHLTLTYLFSPFARIFSRVVHGLSLSSLDEIHLRERFALLLLAVFSATRAVLFLEVARHLKVGLTGAILVCAIGFFSFSNLMFGAIPESFPLSATCIVIAYFLALRPLRIITVGEKRQARIGRITKLLWCVVFVAGTGITITNVIALAILLLLFLHRNSQLALPGKVAIVCAASFAAVALSVAMAATAKVILRTNTTEIAYSPTVDQYTHEPRADVVSAIARAVGNGLIAGRAQIEPLVVRPGKTAWYKVMMTYETVSISDPASWIRFAGVALAVALGAAAFVRRRVNVDVVLASAAIVGYNLAMHLFFGDEYVLYSLHWHYSLIILASGLLLYAGRQGASRVVMSVAAVAIAMVAANNLARIMIVVRTLEAEQLDSPITPNAEISRSTTVTGT